MRLSSSNRRGAVAILVAVCLLALFSIAALAIDGGLLREHRRSVQVAADAAALAAASQLYGDWSTYHGVDASGGANSNALLTAAANGFNNDGVTNTVVINIPPSSGLFASSKGYAEVIITYNQRRAFSAVFGSSDIPVQARAVARGKKNASSIGVLLLNPTAQGSLTLTGSAGVVVAGSVIVNSNSSKAAVSSGSAGLKSTELYITGGKTSSSTSYFSADTIQLGVTPTPDPLSDLPTPDPSSMYKRSNSTYSPISGETLMPGVYQGGISISSKPNVTLAPGIYYMEGGGFTMSGGSSSLFAEGVMIYNGPDSKGNTGTITVSGGGAVTMSPLDSGDYAGMAIFQDRAATAKITLSGGSNWDFKGTVYAAKAHMNISGGSGGSMGSQYISDTLTLSGSSTFQDIDPSLGYAPRDIRLVE